MAQAVQNLYPNAKVAIGPSIDTGFYYDFECQSFTRDDLDAIEKEMKKIIKKGICSKEDLKRNIDVMKAHRCPEELIRQILLRYRKFEKSISVLSA